MCVYIYICIYIYIHIQQCTICTHIAIARMLSPKLYTLLGLGFRGLYPGRLQIWQPFLAYRQVGQPSWHSCLVPLPAFLGLDLPAAEDTFPLLALPFAFAFAFALPFLPLPFASWMAALVFLRSWIWAKGSAGITTSCKNLREQQLLKTTVNMQRISICISLAWAFIGLCLPFQVLHLAVGDSLPKRGWVSACMG